MEHSGRGTHEVSRLLFARTSTVFSARLLRGLSGSDAVLSLSENWIFQSLALRNPPSFELTSCIRTDLEMLWLPDKEILELYI